MKSGNAFKYIGIVGILLLAAFAFYFASTFTSQSTENRSKAAVTKMYYYNTQTSTCTITPIGFASVSACQSALGSYGSATSGVCYTSLSACQSANGVSNTPISTVTGTLTTTPPTGGSSKKWYLNGNVCSMTTALFANTTTCATSMKTTCYDTFQQCSQANGPTPSTAGSTKKWYNNGSGCAMTTTVYATAAACSSAMQKTCYDTFQLCNQGASQTPTQSPTATNSPTPTASGTGSILYYYNTLNTTCSPTADKYSSIDSCQSFLTQYASTYTSKICYSTIASCQEANGATFMYFYNTNTLACTQTAEKYVDSTKCDANLALYNPGITTSICYKTQQACLNAMYYFNETANACIGTRESYATVAACENVLNTTLAGKTGGICYTDYSLCKNAMYYYNKDSKMCLGTREKYATIDACQTSTATSLPGKTTGICYATLADCKAVLKRSDLNLDGLVDIFDYNILVENFDKTGSNGFIRADIDKNGVVDIFDYNILVTDFGM